MSFGIRPTYKKRILVNNNPTDDVPTYNHDENKKLVETMLQFSRRSGTSNISQQELENIIRKSSINPNHFPKMQETIDKIIQDKKATEDAKGKKPASSRKTRGAAAASTAPPTNVHGFSNASTSANSTSAFQMLIDEELNRELDKVRGVSSESGSSATTTESADQPDEESTTETEEQPVDGESEEERQARLADQQTRRALANGFPKAAAMLRGYDARRSGTSGGIRRTAQGMVDGF